MKIKNYIIYIFVLLLVSCSLNANLPESITSQSSGLKSPSKPTELKAESGNKDRINLSWKASSNTTNYMILKKKANTTSRGLSDYIDTDFDLVEVVSSSVLNYEVKVEEGSYNVFKVVALTKYDDVIYSAASDSVEAVTAGEIYLSAFVDKTTLKLTFSDSMNNYGGITYYENHYKLEVKGVDWPDYRTLFETGDELGVKDYFEDDILNLNLSMGNEYKFRLTATTDKGYVREVTNDFVIEPYTVPSKVTNVVATQGNYENKVALSWYTPEKDSSLTKYSNRYIIYRATVVDEKMGKWEELFNDTTNATSQIACDNNTCTYIDETVAQKTSYVYKVINCYVDAKLNVTIQDETDFLQSNEAWAFWPLESGKLANFVKNDALDKGTIMFSFTYAPVIAENIEFKLNESVWNQSTNATTSSEAVIDPIGVNNTYSFTKEIVSENAEILTTYEYVLNIYLADTLKYSIPLIKEDGSTISLGSIVATTEYIKDVTASDSLYKAIKLSWTETVGLTNPVYSIFENGVELTQLPSVERGALDKDGNTPCSIELISADDRNSYRIKVTGKNSENIDISYTIPSLIYGNFLTPVSGFEASLGTSISKINLLWNASKDDNVLYQVAYRVVGETDYQEIDIADVNASSYSFLPTEAGTNEAGKNYEFKIRAYNKTQTANIEEKFTPWSEVSVGALFGPYGQTVSATDAIDSNIVRIYWSKVPRALSYNVYRIEPKATTLISENNKGMSFEDSTILKIPSSEDNTYPLSASYSYLVVAIPDTTIVKEDLSSYQVGFSDNGSLFAPPINIVASKAEFTDKIVVSWDPVLNATSYYVYLYTKDASDSLVELSSAPVNKPYYEVTENLSQPIYFTVKSVSAEYDIISCEQTVFHFINGEQANIGYALNSVKEITFDQTDEANLRFTFPLVYGATSYILETSAFKTAIDVTTLAKGQSSIINDENITGNIALSQEGDSYTITIERPKYNVDTLIYKLFAKRGDLLSTPSASLLLTQKPTALELVNVLNNFLQTVLNGANLSYDGDWWNGSGFSGPTVRSYTGYKNAEVKSIGGSAWSSTQIAGSFTATNAPLSLNNQEIVVTSTALSLWAKDLESAGYLGNDQLEKIEPGTFTFTYPERFGLTSVTVKITTTLNVYDKQSGKYLVTIDGVETEIDYSDSTVNAIKNW